MPWFLGEWRDELGISVDQADEWRRADVADRRQAGFTWPAFLRLACDDGSVTVSDVAIRSAA